MFKRKNSNIFVGERAYQMTRFLTFRSPSIEQKFQNDTFLRTKYFVQGYILICFLYLIWNTLFSTCFNFYHSCKFTTLLIGSLFFLIGTYIPIRAKKVFVIRAMLLVPCLYIHLLIVDTYTYHLSVHLIVMQSVFTSNSYRALCSIEWYENHFWIGGLTINSWRQSLLFNLSSYGLLFFTISFFELEFMVNQNAISFFEDLLLHNLIPLVITAYIEKVRNKIKLNSRMLNDEMTMFRNSNKEIEV